MTFEEWEANTPPSLKRDPIWRMRVFRLACYAGHLGWADATELSRHPLMQKVASQLLDALGSVRATLAEGYSRSGGRDRVRYFEYALGSSREAREWYLHAEPVLGKETVNARCEQLTEVNRIMLAIIPRERSRSVATSAPEPTDRKRRRIDGGSPAR